MPYSRSWARIKVAPGSRQDLSFDRARLSRVWRIARTIGDQSRSRKLGHHLLALSDAVHRLGDDFSDHGCRQIPLGQYLGYRVLVSPLRHDEHSLLGFAEQDLVRRHSTFAGRDFRDIDGDADVPAFRHLRRRRRKTGRAHVLDRDDVSALDQLETRFEKQLLREWVADLNARSLCVA